MLVVLCHGSDASALWACERLRARSRAPVELVLVESLGFAATSWRHELGADGARTEIGHAGGRLRSGEATAVLNRMLQPPLGALAAAAPEDASYARGELTAFAASWVRTLAPIVVNAPTPQGLCGRWRSPLQWRVLALQAGLAVAPLTLDSEHPPADPYGRDDGTPSTIVLTIGGEPLTSAMPAELRAATRRFAELARTPILGLAFAGDDPARGGWRLLDATPYPDLAGGGEAAIDALEAQLAA